MQIETKVLMEIPCLKCMLWEPLRDPVNCDPVKCPTLTEWLFKEAEKFRQPRAIREQAYV